MNNFFQFFSSFLSKFFHANLHNYIQEDRTAKKQIGASCNCFLPIFFLPMRVCKTANGSGFPLTAGIISPSITTPSGNKSFKIKYSGNLSVINSSPRLHTNSSLFLFITWPRMPSHFHSACHSSGSPKVSGSSSRA